jgi:hypothetical protein
MSIHIYKRGSTFYLPLLMFKTIILFIKININKDR